MREKRNRREEERGSESLHVGMVCECVNITMVTGHLIYNERENKKTDGDKERFTAHKKFVRI